MTMDTMTITHRTTWKKMWKRRRDRPAQEDPDHTGRKELRVRVFLTGPGHVISFHVPKGLKKRMEELAQAGGTFGAEGHMDPFSKQLGGELLPPGLRKMKKERKESESVESGVKERKR